MKKSQSVAEIVLCQSICDVTAPNLSRLSFTDSDSFSRPCSRLSSTGSSYKESQLWLSANGEFQRHYNSIMDPGLVDSCVEALNDITIDEEELQLRRSNENLMFSSLSNRLARVAGKNVGSGANGAPLSDEEVVSFERWLTGMEQRVAIYPTLSQIYAMEANDMRYHLRLHSSTFNDIVAQPCIVKDSKRDDHRALEERYHLLYLRAYEVLLLLEGLPFDQTNNSTTIFDAEYDQNPSFDDEVFGDRIKSPIDYNDRPFQYQYQLTDSCGASEKTALFDTDLLSIFDNSDSDIDEPLVTNGIRPHRMQTNAESTQSESEKETEACDDSYTAPNAVHGTRAAAYFDQSISIYADNTTTVNTEIVFNKVQNWLNCRTINQSTFQSVCGSNYVYIYKAKSEANMGAAPANWGEKRLSSSSTSLQCISPLSSTRIDRDLEDPIDDSLVWDGFQPDFQLLNQPTFHHFDLDGLDEYHMGETEWNLCFFGEDYEQYVDPETVSINSDDSMREVLSDVEEFWLSDKLSHNSSLDLTKPITDDEQSDSNATVGHIDCCVTEKALKRRRRRNNRRVKKLRNQQISTPALSSKASILCSSATNSDDYESATDAPPSTTDSARSIRYNSAEQSFEVYSSSEDEKTTPIRHKVNELRPEDFHDIIRKCQSNIDCVITVLGAEPNRLLTVKYCQKMKKERRSRSASRQNSDSENCHCGSDTKLAATNGVISKNYVGLVCRCREATCLCTWVAQTIAMIINFLLDCWNIFRNMRLYSYLGKVLQGFFASTKEVAKRIKLDRELTRSLTYTYC